MSRARVLRVSTAWTRLQLIATDYASDSACMLPDCDEGWARRVLSSKGPRRRCTASALLGLLVFVAAPVRAADRLEPRDAPLELTWSAPANCPQRADVLKHIDSLLGDSGNAQTRSSVVARGVIEPAGERFQLTLGLRENDTTGKRVITSDNCESLGKAAAVIVGLVIRRERQLGRQLSDQEISGVLGDPSNPNGVTPSPSGRAGSAENQPAKPNPDQQVAPTAPPDHDWHLTLFAPLASIDYRTLPTESFGVGLAVGVVRESWRLIFATQFWLPQSKSSSDTQVYEARFRRQSLELWDCHGWRWNSFEVGPCARLHLDLIQARASGDRLSARTRWAPVPSAGAGLLALWHFHSRAALVLAGSGRAFLFRPEFVVEGVDATARAYREPFGTAEVSVAGAWIF